MPSIEVGLEHARVACDPGLGSERRIEAICRLRSSSTLLCWIGRGAKLRTQSPGTIPGGLLPILDRLGLNGECWLETTRHFGRWFKRAAGGRESLAAAASRCGRRWFHGQVVARVAFQ